jgi:agmatine deiminase
MLYPAEWAPHEWVWIGFPSDGTLWEADLDPAQTEVAAFARAVHAGGKGEQVRLVAADAVAAARAAELAPFATIVEERFGDIWLRDSGPVILKSGAGRLASSFRFNGWGGKYDLEGDDTIGQRLAATMRAETRRRDWVLEGGAIDVDGAGLLSREQIEQRLRSDLGVERILWLGEGLLNDHTDGHVDNLARFVAEATLAVPVPEPGDPNAAVYEDARRRAEAFGLKVVPIPSPGRVERDGEIVPASYMNFYIGNAAVVVPLYGAPNDEAAVAAIGALFPGREAVGLRADHVLTGGGSFHCISQQVPE